MFFFLTVVLLVSACTTSYPHDTPETFATSIFHILQNQDREGLNQFIATQEDVFALLEKMEQIPKKRQLALKVITEEWDRIHSEMVASIDAAWTAFYAEVAAAQVDLKVATFSSAVAKTAEEEGFVQGDIDILLEYQSQIYRIQIVDAGETPRGWILGRQGFAWMSRN